MSASDKLRDLHDDMTPAPWTISEDGDSLFGPPDDHAIEWELGFALGNAGIVALRNALPDIIAVIAAAERITPSRKRADALRDALAALNARLTDSSDGGAA